MSPDPGPRPRASSVTPSANPRSAAPARSRPRTGTQLDLRPRSRCGAFQVLAAARSRSSRELPQHLEVGSRSAGRRCHSHQTRMNACPSRLQQWTAEQDRMRDEPAGHRCQRRWRSRRATGRAQLARLLTDGPSPRAVAAVRVRHERSDVRNVAQSTWLMPSRAATMALGPRFFAPGHGSRLERGSAVDSIRRLTVDGQNLAFREWQGPKT